MTGTQTETVKTKDLPVKNLFSITEKNVDGARPLCEMGKLFYNPKIGTYLAHTGTKETLGISAVAIVEQNLGAKKLEMGVILNVSNRPEESLKKICSKTALTPL